MPTELKFPLLTHADFTGVHELSYNEFKETELDNFIANSEKKYVRMMLSDKAYSDLVTASSELKYIELFNGVTYMSSEGEVLVNEGLKEVLKYLIRSGWLAYQYQQTQAGYTKNQNENSTVSGDNVNTQIIYDIYNSGLYIYNSDVVVFVNKKMDTTGYEGFEKFKMPIIDYLFL